jgi:tryptophan synthase alpha chain
VAVALIDAGADVLEIGLPYSDPLADGATIQRASSVALANGASLDDSIALIGRIHQARPRTPLVTMGYVNQVLGGKDGATVLRRLAEAGVSGFILADITPDESADLEAEAAGFGIGLIYLVAPTTPADRLPFVASRSQGFLYAVSLAGVTGARTSLPPGVKKFLRGVREVSPVPVAVGFGVSTSKHAHQLAPVADGVITASALIDALGPDGKDIAAMTELARSLRKACARA